MSVRYAVCISATKYARNLEMLEAWDELSSYNKRLSAGSGGDKALARPKTEEGVNKRRGRYNTPGAITTLDKRATFVGITTLNKTGGGATLAGLTTSWGASTVHGRRTTLAKWGSTAAMVAAVIISIVWPVEGGVVALIANPQEDGIGGIRSRRWAMRGERIALVTFRGVVYIVAYLPVILSS